MALGVVRSSSEATNGVIAWVDDAELDALDGRERNVRPRRRHRARGRPRARDAERSAAPRSSPTCPVPGRSSGTSGRRAAGVAAITLRYWELVDGAFADLGADHRARYHATTPAPDIPIIEQPAHEIPDRHRGATSTRQPRRIERTFADRIVVDVRHDRHRSGSRSRGATVRPTDDRRPAVPCRVRFPARR